MNPARGEAAISIGGDRLVLRPTFAALVAAENELGPLFPLAERAAAGGLKLSEMATLFWYCIHERPAALTLERLGEALVERGVAKATPVLKLVLTQILQGRV